jgi:hypothetical protein
MQLPSWNLLAMSKTVLQLTKHTSVVPNLAIQVHIRSKIVLTPYFVDVSLYRAL